MTKKIISLTLILLVSLASCQNKNNYTIEGNLNDTNLNDMKIYLYHANSKDELPIDSAMLTKGNFKFNGEIIEPAVVNVILKNTDTNNPPNIVATLLLESGKISIDFKDSNATIKGTPNNEKFSEFQKKTAVSQHQRHDIFMKFEDAVRNNMLTPELDKSLNKDFDKIVAEEQELYRNFIKENIKNPLGKYAFEVAIYQRTLKPDQQREILPLLDEKFKNTELVKKIIALLENSEKVEIGKKFVDFKMQDINGNYVSLSDYAGKGQYVLLDFWASWCSPCMQEMPNVVEMYNKYKSKGFTVFGVSLDANKEEWIKTINTMKLHWTHVSDFKGWKNEAATLYAVDGIPHTVLIDKEGTIVAKNIYGQELNNKLAELLK